MKKPMPKKCTVRLKILGTDDGTACNKGKNFFLHHKKNVFFHDEFLFFFVLTLTTKQLSNAPLSPRLV